MLTVKDGKAIFTSEDVVGSYVSQVLKTITTFIEDDPKYFASELVRIYLENAYQVLLQEIRGLNKSAQYTRQGALKTVLEVGGVLPQTLDRMTLEVFPRDRRVELLSSFKPVLPGELVVPQIVIPIKLGMTEVNEQLEIESKELSENND